MSEPQRWHWRLRTLLEILPVLIALTALGSYASLTRSSQVALVAPFSQVWQGVPGWVVVLLGLVLLVGLTGMGWLLYIFSRSQVASHDTDEV